MARPLHFALLLSMFAASVAHAQSLPAPLAAPAKPAVTPAAGATAEPSAPAPRTVHAISPDVAAQLAASRPKFTPVAPPPPPKPEEELPDLRETDKPKNTIVRLPKYVVQEPRPPVFRELDIHTKQGLANLAMRRYLTETDRALNRFRLPLFSPFSTNGGSGSNEDRAMAMYYEDERLKEMADTADKTNMVMRSDATEGKKVQGAARQTFMRWQDFGWQGGNKK
jgi:hypothetical protein